MGIGHCGLYLRAVYRAGVSDSVAGLYSNDGELAGPVRVSLQNRTAAADGRNGGPYKASSGL